MIVVSTQETKHSWSAVQTPRYLLQGESATLAPAENRCLQIEGESRGSKVLLPMDKTDGWAVVVQSFSL